METEFFKLEIFVPESHFEAVRQALLQADAGHIGNYDSCLSVSRVTGMWRALEGTHPYLGETGELCTAEELKVEVTVRAEALRHTLALVKEAHPYEEPVINVIALYATGL